MCEFCKWQETVVKIDKHLKDREKDFIYGVLEAISQKAKKEKHCSKNQTMTVKNIIRRNVRSPKKKK